MSNQACRKYKSGGQDHRPANVRPDPAGLLGVPVEPPGVRPDLCRCHWRVALEKRKGPAQILTLKIFVAPSAPLHIAPNVTFLVFYLFNYPSLWSPSEERGSCPKYTFDHDPLSQRNIFILGLRLNLGGLHRPGKRNFNPVWSGQGLGHRPGPFFLIFCRPVSNRVTRVTPIRIWDDLVEKQEIYWRKSCITQNGFCATNPSIPILRDWPA